MPACLMLAKNSASVSSKYFFGENLVRIDGVDLFLVYLCGTKRQGDGGLSFPTADFDDRAFALVELA
jgi:hypothetical protein